MEISGQLHTPANLPPGRNPGTHEKGGCVGRRGGVDNCKGREILNVVGNRTRTVQPVARSLRYLATCHKCYGLQNWCVTVSYLTMLAPVQITHRRTTGRRETNELGRKW
jgi:hypothetical protein